MVSETAQSLDTVTILEIPRAIDQWVRAGAAVADLGLIVEEGANGARVTAVTRGALEAVGQQLVDDVEALRLMLEDVRRSAGPDDIPCIFGLPEGVTVGLIDVTAAREDAARVAVGALAQPMTSAVIES